MWTRLSVFHESFPAEAARWCLAEAGISPEELDHLAVSRDPRANVGQKLLRTIRHGASARYLKARLQNAAKIRDVKAAISDAFGILVKQASLGLTAAQSDWIVGEGLFGPTVKGKGIRSMAAPGTS